MKNDNTQKVRLGDYNTLRVVRKVDHGLYLDGGPMGDILMPKRYVRPDLEVGDMADVFVYLDSEDRPVATTETPLARVGEFAYLRVKAVTRFGAFLDWGLAKDLLVPYNEQRNRMEVDKSYVVYIFVDEGTHRITGTEKTNRFLGNVAPRYKAGDRVKALISERTDIGFRAIVDNLHHGMIYLNENHMPIRVGETRDAYVVRLRDDDRIDLSLLPTGYAKVDSLKETIIRRLRENGGHMAVGDKTDAQTIMLAFGCSKKTFKMTIGTLYREGTISISPNGITLMQ